MNVDHYLMWNDHNGSAIHLAHDCHHIPRRYDGKAWVLAAAMGRTMTLLEAAAATDLTLCPCATDATALRDAAIVLHRYGTDADALVTDTDGCLICHAQWVHRPDGGELQHERLCVVPVITWMG